MTEVFRAPVVERDPPIDLTISESDLYDQPLSRPEAYEKIKKILDSSLREPSSVANLLLPYDHLHDITKSWPEPLIIERYKPGEPSLAAIGLEHSTEIGSTPYRALLEVVRRFEEREICYGTSPQGQVIIREGSETPLVLDEAAYTEHSERGVAEMLSFLWDVPRLAETKDIAPLGWTAEQILERGFTKEEFATYLLYRIVPQWALDHRPERPDFREYAEAHLKNKTMPLLQSHGFDFSYDRLAASCERTFNKPFDPHDSKFYWQRAVGYMLPVDTTMPESEQRMQQMIIAYNQLRDVRLAQTVEALYRNGYSVLLIFGWPHVRTLQPMLESIYF